MKWLLLFLLTLLPIVLYYPPRHPKTPQHERPLPTFSPEVNRFLATPGNLTVTDMGNERDVLLTWIDNSHGEIAFLYQRQTLLENGTWGLDFFYFLPPNTTQHVDQTVRGQHRYRIRALAQP